MPQSVPKLWIFFFVIVAVLVGAILTTGPSTPAFTQTQTNAPEPTRSTTFEEMLGRGGNAIYLENQTTGSTTVLVGFAVLSKPGFIVVYDDNGGVPGSIIGASSLLESGGEYLVVGVEEPLVEGRVYYAMLYHDDGDERFRVQEDTQVVDSEQSVILMNFIATTQAEPESGSVKI